MGITDFILDRKYKHGKEVDKGYQKRCNEKIKQLCGGFTSSDSFVERAKRYRIADRYTATYEKHILKFECKYGRLKYEDIEKRLNQLLQMDTVTLLDIMADEDTSKFKTQRDIEEHMGEGYVCKLNGKLKTNPSIYPKYTQITKEQRTEQERQRRERQRLAQEKRKDDYRRNKQRIHLDSQARKTTQTKYTSGIKQEQKTNKSTYHRPVNESKNEEIPKEKLNLIKRGRADIEIYTKVKSNTALASTALFLATGVLVAEAKEEMKYVKTQIEIKDDRIIIKRPYIYHKYKDFRFFKVDQEDDYYLFYIGFSDEELIHFKTKEKYLVEIIMDKINETGLQYEHV